MTPFLIVLCAIGGFLLLLFLLLLFGRAKVWITVSEGVRVGASVLGVRLRLYPKKGSERPDPLPFCEDPGKVLKQERRRQEKERKKALKKQKRAQKKTEKRKKSSSGGVTPNLMENIAMVSALLKKLYKIAKGKIRIEIVCVDLTVGTDDAAKTAILYGSAAQAVLFLREWIRSVAQSNWKIGLMDVRPDFTSEKCRADVDIRVSIPLLRGGILALRALSAYNTESANTKKKARARLAAKKRAG